MTATTRPPIGDTEPPRPTIDRDGRRRARRTLAGIAGVALFVDLWAQTPLAGTAALAAVLAVVALLLTTGAVQGWGRALVLASLLPAAFLPLRSAGWLVALDVLAVAAVLALGAALGAHGDPFDRGFTHHARGLGRIASGMVRAPAVVIGAAVATVPPGTSRRGAAVAAIGRGLLLGVPVLVAVGLLLASGDAVFASLVDVSIDAGTMMTHGIVAAMGAWVAAAYLAASFHPAPTPEATARHRIGWVEASLVLGCLIAVYGAYALARLTVVLRGDGYVQQTTGLTYAEYAPSGFFQLLWAAGITLVVLLALHATVDTPTRAARWWVASLSLAAVALTLVMVHGAVVRLDLYEQAFGATVLRWSSTVFAGWVGIAFLLAGAALAGVLPGRRWLAGTVMWSALVTLVVVNVADPEARVMATNAERAAASGEVDVSYALSLSDDAVPALVAVVPDIADDDERRLVVRSLCARRDTEATAWNLSARRAQRSLDQLCD